MSPDLEEKIRKARLPGLIRAIAAAENRAAVARARRLDPAGADQEAAALRAELARVAGDPVGAAAAALTPPDPESAEAAAERVMAELQPAAVRHAALQQEIAALRPELPRRGPAPQTLRVMPGFSLRRPGPAATPALGP